MNVTFTGIIKIYLVVLMIVHLLIITDDLCSKTSKPLVVDSAVAPIVLVLEKGPIFPKKWKIIK